MDRTPLQARPLPDYTRGEEITNMVTHIVGGALGIAICALCIVISCVHHNMWGLAGSIVYGTSLIALYSISSIYHGMKPCTAKRVMRIIDHCTIYFLICGSYTPILFSAIRVQHPVLCWIVFGAEFALAALATVFTAIDLTKYSKFSMLCYILMGWLIVFAVKPTIEAVTLPGFIWLLSGGVAYTVGAILYGIGKSKRYFHSIFHVFVILGSMLQAVCILKYVL